MSNIPVHPDQMTEVQPTGQSHHTIQMETDTVTEEREVLLQRALSVSSPDEARAIRNQIVEHMEMYEGDEGLGVLAEQLDRFDKMFDSQTPASVDYMGR